MSTKGQLDWLQGINSPRRPSASPKRKAKRGNTPPAKRTSFVQRAEEQPFGIGGRPAPLTPLGWDVNAARAADTIHPSDESPKIMAADDPDNPNALARRLLKRQGRWGKEASQRKGGQKGKAQKGKGAGADGKGKAKKGAGKKGKGKQAEAAARVVKFTPPPVKTPKARGKRRNNDELFEETCQGISRGGTAAG